jgi:hypothetical protein
LLLALTDCPVNKPAKISRFKFPCRTIFPRLIRTLSYHPAGHVLLTGRFLESQKEEDLTFNMDGPGYSSTPAQNSVSLQEKRPKGGPFVVVFFPSDGEFPRTLFFLFETLLLIDWYYTTK